MFDALTSVLAASHHDCGYSNAQKTWLTRREWSAHALRRRPVAEPDSTNSVLQSVLEQLGNSEFMSATDRSGIDQLAGMLFASRHDQR